LIFGLVGRLAPDSSHPSTATRKPQSTRDLARVSFEEFKDLSARAAVTGHYRFNRTPDVIEFGDSLVTVLQNIERKTIADGNERARTLYIDGAGDKIFVDRTTIGDSDSVTQEFRPWIDHEGERYWNFGAVHTHPVDHELGAKLFKSSRQARSTVQRAAEHMSVQDLVAFLGLQHSSDMVLTEGNWLLATKTPETPSFNSFLTPNACVQIEFIDDADNHAYGLIEKKHIIKCDGATKQARFKMISLRGDSHKNPPL
jgi:hypothetical protein